VGQERLRPSYFFIPLLYISFLLMKPTLKSTHTSHTDHPLLKPFGFTVMNFLPQHCGTMLLTMVCGWVGWVHGWAEEWVDGWAVCEVWVGLRVGFININDMYNNDVCKGGAQGCEAYEAK
jgi:hypothetical protein